MYGLDMIKAMNRKGARNAYALKAARPKLGAAVDKTIKTAPGFSVRICGSGAEGVKAALEIIRQVKGR